jgi:hypothetical protein
LGGQLGGLGQGGLDGLRFGCEADALTLNCQGCAVRSRYKVELSGHPACLRAGSRQRASAPGSRPRVVFQRERRSHACARSGRWPARRNDNDTAGAEEQDRVTPAVSWTPDWNVPSDGRRVKRVPAMVDEVKVKLPRRPRRAINLPGSRFSRTRVAASFFPRPAERRRARGDPDDPRVRDREVV